MKVGKQVFVALIDQGLLSATSFAVGLLLINFVPKTEYGLFVLATTVILFVVGYQNALITTQMTVLSPKKPQAEQKYFCAALGLGQYGIFIPLLLLASLIAILLNMMSVIEDFATSLVVIGSLVTIAILRKEFMRSYFFLKLSPKSVLLIDVIYVVLMFTGMFVTYLFQREHLVIGCLVSMGFASLVAWFVGAKLSDLPSKSSVVEARAAVSEAMHQGKWAAGGVTVTNLQSHSYVYLLAVFGGGAYVAEAAAARLFLTPIAILSTSASKTLMPRWAIELREKGGGAVRGAATKILFVLLTIVVLYITALVFFSPWLTEWFLTPEYKNVELLLLLWGAVFFFQTIRMTQSIQLQIMQRFKTIMNINILSSIVVILSSIFLIAQYGAPGSIGSMILGEILLAYLLVCAVKKVGIKNNEN